MTAGPILTRVAVVMRMPLPAITIEAILHACLEQYRRATVETNNHEIRVIITEAVSDDDPRLIQPQSQPPWTPGIAP